VKPWREPVTLVLRAKKNIGITLGAHQATLPRKQLRIYTSHREGRDRRGEGHCKTFPFLFDRDDQLNLKDTGPGANDPVPLAVTPPL